MSTELGVLVTRFTADISSFEAGNKRVEAGAKQTAKVVTDSHRQMATSAKGLRGGMQELSASIGTLQGPLGGVAGRLSSLSTLLTSATGATGGLIAVIGIGTAAIAGFAAGVYTLANNAAMVSDKIGDMADKINISVRTISGLAPAIESSGSSLEGFSAAMGIFDKNIEAVAQGDERLSKLFKALKIDATDNEKAFRQVADILFKLDGSAQQTALAMELFGRSGKDVLGIIKATGGNVEEFIKQMEALGIVIDDKAVKAADALDKQMITVRAQLAAVERQLGEELIPLVSEAAINLSNWMKENQGQIRKTIVEIGSLIKTVANLAQYIKYVTPIILVVEVIRKISNLVDPGISLGERGKAVIGAGVGSGVGVGIGTGIGGRGLGGRAEDAGEFAIAGGAGQYSVGAQNSPRGGKTEADRLEDLIRSLLARGGRGGGGGGKKSDPAAEMKKLAEVQLRIIEEGLKREEDDIERSYDRRRLTVEVYQRALTRLEENRHKATLDTLNDEEKAINSSKTLTVAEKKIQLTEILLKRQQEANRHRREEASLEDKILGITRERLVTAERLAGLETRSRRALPDIGAVTRPRRAEEDIGGITRPRVATEAEKAAREQYQLHLAKMRQLASDLTNILDRAIYDGFQGGLKRGFQSLALGVLDLLKNVFMKRLEDILTNAFSGIGQGGGGGKGGFLSGLIGIFAGALGGGFGGGSNAAAGGLGTVFAGSFASGGTIPMGQYGMVHDNERVVSTPYGALVIPSQTTNNNSGGNTVININIPESRSADSYKSPRSRRELATQIASTLQGHLR